MCPFLSVLAAPSDNLRSDVLTLAAFVMALHVSNGIVVLRLPVLNHRVDSIQQGEEVSGILNFPHYCTPTSTT